MDNPTSADLSAFLALGNQLAAAFVHAPTKLADPMFLARMAEKAVDIYRAGPQGDEAQRTAIQRAFHELVSEFGGQS